MKFAAKIVLKQYGMIILFAIIASVLIRFYIFETYQISTPFMSPTLISGDVIFVEKWPFLFSSPNKIKRGDILVYTGKQNSLRANKEFVRRVIGLPGDEIALQNGALYLNKAPMSTASSPSNELCHLEKLPDSFHYEACYNEPRLEDFSALQIEKNTLFVIADYRSHELKGHPIWEKISYSQVVGRVSSIWISSHPNRSYYDFLPRLRWDRVFKKIPREN